MTALPRLRRREKMGLRGPDPFRCPAHLRYVARHECAARSEVCRGRIDPHHLTVDIPDSDKGGMGRKNADWWTVPLCRGHHDTLHQMGERAFSAIHDLDLPKIAAGLWRRSPARLTHLLRQEGKTA